MGLFSSKKKTKVGTQVQRVVDDDQLPDTIKTSLMRAIMDPSEESSIPEHLINGFSTSVALKADRLFRFAQDEYSYGIPRSDIVVRNRGEDIVKQVLENSLGFPITIDYLEFSGINAIHVGWVELMSQYDYDPNTNEIKALSLIQGTPVYLDDMLAVFTQLTFDEADTNALAQWGTAASAGFTPERPLGSGDLDKFKSRSHFVVDAAAIEDTVEITYVWTNGVGDVVKDMLVVSLAAFDEDVEFYHVKYHYDEVVGLETIQRTGYWVYENGAGIYPTIDAIQEFPFDNLGSFFPFVHFRRDKVNMATPDLEGTPDFDTSKKLMDLFNMDFVAVTEAIHENPDIADVEQAMMITAVDVDDTSEVGRRYLFDHFNALWSAGQGQFVWEDQVARGHQFVQVIADREFQMTFRHSGISKRRRAGKIAEVGKHHSGRSDIVFEEVFNQRGLAGVLTQVVNQTTDQCLLYQRQINDNMYDEICVSRPELVYHIFRSKTHVAGFGADALVIPVDYSLIGDYSLPDREVLFARSFHFVFNTRVTTKVKWYQTGIFKLITFIIVVVVLVLSGFNPLATIMLAVEAGALAVVELILTQIIIGILIEQAAKLIISVVGGDLALVLAAVAAVVAIAASPSGVGSLKGAPWAQDLLMAANGLSQGVAEEARDLLGNLKEEAELFQSFAEGQTKLLEEAQDLLRVSTLIDPFEFIGLAPFSIAGEQPQDYYNRTIHSGNIGMRGINAISGYVEAALTLPTFNDTQGDNSDE